MTQWQPQYDPDEHARRLDQGAAPQGYGQQRQPPPGQWPPQQPQYPPQYQQPQPGWQQPPQYPPPGPGRRQPPRKRKGGLAAFLIGGTIAVIVVIAIAASANSGKTPAASASPPGTTSASAPAHSGPAAAAAAQTLTYSVTGSAADVTYGPAGSSLSGSVPMRKTDKLGSKPAAYYSIDAQLSGGGKVTCEILISGKVISKASASGEFNIASCEISQDPFSGNWTDANAA